MRVLIVVMLLAGCSGPGEPEPASETPVSGAVEVAQMPTVRGTIERTGMYDRVCAAVSVTGDTLSDATALSFKVPANATTVMVEATWEAPNPTVEALDFLVKGDEGGVVFSGLSPTTTEYPAGRLNGTHHLQIAPPDCRGVAHVGVYHDVAVDVVVRFT